LVAYRAKRFPRVAGEAFVTSVLLVGQRRVAVAFASVTVFVAGVFVVLAQFGPVTPLLASTSPARGLVVRLAMSGGVSAAIAAYLGLRSTPVAAAAKWIVMIAALGLCLLHWGELPLLPAAFATVVTVWWMRERRAGRLSSGGGRR
jgi:hypothetical protein